MCTTRPEYLSDECKEHYAFTRGIVDVEPLAQKLRDHPELFDVGILASNPKQQNLNVDFRRTIKAKMDNQRWFGQHMISGASTRSYLYFVMIF